VISDPLRHVKGPLRNSAALRSSLASGVLVDDCRKTYGELSAKGVIFIQEPQDRPYGVEALMRDNSGNWLVLVEPREFTEADFEASDLDGD
jgi:hypothetical protein